jgi:hypothetical protein
MQLTDLMTYAYADTDTSGPDANGRRNDRARGRNLPRRGLRLVVAARGGIGSVRTGLFCRQRHAGIFGELVFKLAALSGEGLAKVALGLLKLSRSLGFILIARTAARCYFVGAFAGIGVSNRLAEVALQTIAYRLRIGQLSFWTMAKHFDLIVIRFFQFFGFSGHVR